MFGLVLAFVHWGYVYLLHCIIIEHIPECFVWWHSVSYVFHTGAYPHPWVHQIFCGLSHCSIYFLIFVGHHWGIPPSLSPPDLLRFFSLLDLFLNLCESSHWGIPPLALFYWGIPPLSLGLPCLMLISWLSDPFVDLYELSPRASPYHRLV